MQYLKSYRMVLILLAGLTWVLTHPALATTTQTNSRAEISFMATLWEPDSIQISGLANSQYPQYSPGNWQYIFPHSSISSDGDVHIDMGIDAAGTGSTGGNQGESPIIAEVINAVTNQLNYLKSLSGHQVKTRGIFRFYTEHASERHFELHPITEIYTNNGAFVQDLTFDFRTNILFVADGTGHANSTLIGLFDGSETVTAQVMADNTNIIFTLPSPSVNYVQYDGVALSGLLGDGTSPYFWFRPNLVSAATVRCRLVTNTPAALAATGLSSNLSISVNALTRMDLLVISNNVAGLSANQSSTFARPVELITLSLTGAVAAPFLSVTPGGGFTSSGSVGGPFSPASQDYTLNNSGSGALNWAVSKTASWLTLSAPGGTLAAGASTNVTVSINTNAYTLAVGTNSGSVTFTNTTNGNGNTTRAVTLAVTAPPLSLQSVQTVFVIPMENENWSSIKGSSSAPYLNNTLLPMGAHAEQYYNPPGLHPSMPNYFWLEAGTNFGYSSDLLPSSAHQNTTNHLVTLLKNAGLSWRSYNEDICGCDCPLANTNLYVPRHNPFVYFDDVTNTNNASSAYCLSNVRAYSQLAGDLSSNTVARYNWVVPNLCDDMHNSSPCATTDQIKNGDTWLANNLPAILNSSAYTNNGAVFIVWDEGAGSSDGPIGLIVLSPLAKRGYSNIVHYTHSATLRTMQEIFNVGPLLGDAANSTNLSDLFNFTAQLAVTPATALAASGPAGGPFSPANQIYSLTNTGGASLAWTASVASNWLSLSATSGTLMPGAGTNVTVSINANASALAAGNYSDFVSFSNTVNGVGNTTRAVSLAVTGADGQLAVTPASALNASGLVGGPFAPASQNYGLTNIGGATLSWTAAKTANWLTLSATNGTLAPGAGVTVTASINANANALAAGNYSDTITFTNVTSVSGSTTRAVSLAISSFGFFDDFSTFAPGNLVGQSNWTQFANVSTLPLQVSGGQVAIPFGQSVDNQDAYKNFTATNETVFYGLILTVSNAPASSTTPSYFTAMFTSNNAAGFANYRLAARDNGAGACVLAARITGLSGNPFTYGTSAIAYGTAHRVIVEADSGGTVMKVFVDPTSAVLSAQSYYASNYIGTGTAPLQVGSFVISQFASGTAPNAGVSIGKACVFDNFAAVYNFLTPAPPPVAVFSGSPLSGTETLLVVFTDTSTGSITNRFWNFGDGSSTNVTTNVVTHAYNAGAFDVTLVVSGPGGANTNAQANYITALTAFQSWQLQYFGSTNAPNAAATADPDGDGQNNFTEFRAGTNPTNNASLFRISSVGVETNGVRVSWLTGSGRTNALQRADDWPGGSYSNLATIITTGSVTNFLDSGAATNGAVHFYRVRLLP